MQWLEWKTDIAVQKGFEPYYGEGSTTTVGARRDYPAYHSETVSEIRFFSSDNFSLAPRVGLRTYHALDAGPNPFIGSGRRLVSPAVGLNVRWDLRGKGRDQDEGFLQETEVWGSPGWSEANAGPFATAETRFTEGVTLFSAVRLVTTANLGTTLGQSDYAYRFRLGGSTKLRGYWDNRFRGSHFYLVATELRVPLTRMFAWGIFSEAGEATDRLSELHPKGSYGTGLRIAIPPDGVQWARIDVGFGQDSWALCADFGLPF